MGRRRKIPCSVETLLLAEAAGYSRRTLSKLLGVTDSATTRMVQVKRGTVQTIPQLTLSADWTTWRHAIREWALALADRASTTTPTPASEAPHAR